MEGSANPIERTGLQWIRGANARPLVENECKEVLMRLERPNGSSEMRIRTVRKITGDVAVTMCCALEPVAFRNVSFVMKEQRGSLHDLLIHLYMPFGEGTALTLEPWRRKEGLVGSDFAYEDLKTWLYEEGVDYDAPSNDEEGVVSVPGVCTEDPELVRSADRPFVVALDRESLRVEGITYSGAAGGPEREFRVESWTTIGEAHVPTSMSMADVASGQRTTIELVRAWSEEALDDGLFTLGPRPLAADQLDEVFAR